jgi:hypothetical protein
MRSSDLSEKLLTAVIVVGAAVVVAGAIYTYERYYRPSEAWFYGAWQGKQDGDDEFYFQFRPDHTFSGFIISPHDKEKIPFLKGRWHAGGPYLYLRVQDEDGWPDPVVSRFDIDSGHLTICLPRSREAIWSLKRVADSR